MRIMGVDPGVNTGIALWDCDRRAFEFIETVTILLAIERVRRFAEAGMLGRVRVEDARLRTGGFARADEAHARSGAGIREGVGSVKRDCAIWQELSDQLSVPFEFVRPAAIATKLGAAEFRAATGWSARTSQHGRDAAMLAMGQVPKQLTPRPGLRQLELASQRSACTHCGRPADEHMPGFLRCPSGPNQFGRSKFEAMA